jgi:hypothetical protein
LIWFWGKRQISESKKEEREGEDEGYMLVFFFSLSLAAEGAGGC